MKRFLPLLSITFIVVLFAASHTWFLTWDWQVFMQYFMAGYFLLFGALKVSNWSAFVRSYRKYDWLAARSKTYSWLYPALEVLLGFAYYFDIWPFWLNLFVLALMTEKGISVFLAIKAKRISKCACLGGWFAIPITYVTVFEDFMMAAMAALMLALH
jgi:hypothetical protein